MSDLRPDAHLLAKASSAWESLLGFETENEAHLTNKQKALLRDAAGLLAAIAEGTVISSQPRIRDDLVEVLSIFDDKFPQGVPNEVNVSALLAIIGSMAGVGYTASKHELAKPRRADRSL